MGKLFNAFLTAIILMAIMPVMWSIGSRYEGKIFPVVSRLKLTKIEVNAPGTVDIWVKFNKLRMCEPVGVAWYFKDSSTGKMHPVPLQLRMYLPAEGQGPRGPWVRALGEQEAGPWRIAIPYPMFMRNSYAVVTHRCHGFYLTATTIYP